MCLHVSKNVKVKFNKDGYATAYKIYKKGERRLISLFMGTRTEKPGIKKSNRFTTCLTNDEVLNKIVDLGIHVFLNKKDARKETSYGCPEREIVVPVLVCEDDFVAAGNFFIAKSAVFTKIEITKETWNKIFKD